MRLALPLLGALVLVGCTDVAKFGPLDGAVIPDTGSLPTTNPVIDSGTGMVDAPIDTSIATDAAPITDAAMDAPVDSAADSAMPADANDASPTDATMEMDTSTTSDAEPGDGSSDANTEAG